jgi:Protein of unknown function (DUF3750)
MVSGPLVDSAPGAYLVGSDCSVRKLQLILLIALFVLLFLVPIAVSASIYFVGNRIADWKTADRSSAGLLPPVLPETGAVVRIFSARTVRWRGIVATHSWIVIKEAGAAAYSRFDYTAWGEPIWVDRFVPDGRWFGRMPDVVFAADGSAAEQMIPPDPRCDPRLCLSECRGLSRLARAELEHICGFDHQRRPWHVGCPSADGGREGLSRRPSLDRMLAVRHRNSS